MFWKIPQAHTALQRTGMGEEKIVLEDAVFALPLVHKVKKIDLRGFMLEFKQGFQLADQSRQKPKVIVWLKPALGNIEKVAEKQASLNYNLEQIQQHYKQHYKQLIEAFFGEVKYKDVEGRTDGLQHHLIRGLEVEKAYWIDDLHIIWS